MPEETMMCIGAEVVVEDWDEEPLYPFNHELEVEFTFSREDAGYYVSGKAKPGSYEVGRLYTVNYTIETKEQVMEQEVVSFLDAKAVAPVDTQG